VNIKKSIKKRRKELDDGIRKISAKLRGKTPVHFLHIGKTGGTALKYVFKEYYTTEKYEIFTHSHRVHLNHIPAGEKVLFFLRDPVGKFVSAFYSRKREGRPRTYNPWTRGEREAFENFNTPNELAKALSSENIELKDKAIKAMKDIGHIRKSYWDWFLSEDYFLSRRRDILFVGFQESFNRDFEKLKNILMLPEEATLPTDEINTHRNPLDVDKSLDMDSIENLKKWYEKDYHFIDICKNNLKDID